MWSGIFDIRAKALAFPMPPKKYAELLRAHAETIVSALRKRRLPISEELVDRLTERLTQRHAHWMVSAHAADDVNFPKRSARNALLRLAFVSSPADFLVIPAQSTRRASPVAQV